MTETILNELKIHKIDTYDAWNDKYGDDIGENDLVIIPPNQLQKKITPVSVNTIGIDVSVIQNSTNLITSGAVYTKISNEISSIFSIGTTDPPSSLDNGKFYFVVESEGGET